MTVELLAALASANLAAGAAILAILALRLPVRRLFGARIAYRLWLAAPLAAAAVFIPRPAIIVHLPAAPVRAMADQAIVMLAQGQPGPMARTPLIDLPAALVALWIAGSAIALVLALAAHRRGVATFGPLTRSPNQPGLLRAAREGLGPALIGMFSPKLVLPADFETRFEAREQALVLAHERRHIASGDVRINAVITLLACLNWFNPLVHVAAVFTRIDQELACDAAVIARFPGERRTYAEALLKTQITTAPLPLGCYWPGRSPNLLKERLEMLAKDRPGARRLALGAAVVAALSLGAGLAAWSAQPRPQVFVAGPAPFVQTTPAPAFMAAPVAHPVQLAAASPTPGDGVAPSADSATRDIRAVGDQVLLQAIQNGDVSKFVRPDGSIDWDATTKAAGDAHGERTIAIAPSGDVAIIRYFPLKFLPVRGILDFITKAEPNVTFTADITANALALQGRAADVDHAYAHLITLDQAPASAPLASIAAPARTIAVAPGGERAVIKFFQLKVLRVGGVLDFIAKAEPNVTFTADKAANALILQGRAADVDHAVDHLTTLDQPAPASRPSPSISG